MLGTGLLMGLLFSFQSKSVSRANLYFNRESRVNVFKEMQIVKKGNQNLNEQLSELQKELDNSTDKEKILASINKDISRYEVAGGKTDIHGQGISVEINGELEALWFTDMVNELFSAGAEAISLNGIRIIDKNVGFDTMPNGQILFGGEIISPPFRFEAIGDSKTLLGSINQAGGIINRIMTYRPKYEVKTIENDNIEIKKANQES
jgi:uncharacterized protein YlxW (UPF0749 family)